MKENGLTQILIVLVFYPILAIGFEAGEFLSKQNLQKDKEAINSLKDKVDKLNKENLKLKKEKIKLSEQLAVHKPQNLPRFQQSDILNNHFNVERIFRLRSVNCFDFNGDMSCMYQVLELDHNKTAYLVYKANRVFDSNTKINKIVNKEGELLNLLTLKKAKKIKKWEKKNPDLLILLATY